MQGNPSGVAVLRDNQLRCGETLCKPYTGLYQLFWNSPDYNWTVSRWNLVYLSGTFWGFFSTLTTSWLICQQILERLSSLCVSHAPSGKKNRKHEQRLLRNMGAHTVVLELLQIPYEKVVFFKYAPFRLTETYSWILKNLRKTRQIQRQNSWLNCLFLSYNRRQNCWDFFFADEVLWRTKQSAPSPLPFILRWGCSLFITGSSYSGKRLHGGGGEGKASYPLLKLVKRHKGPQRQSISTNLLLPIVAIHWSFFVVSGKFLNLSVVADFRLVRKKNVLTFLSPRVTNINFLKTISIPRPIEKVVRVNKMITKEKNALIFYQILSTYSLW